MCISTHHFTRVTLSLTALTWICSPARRACASVANGATSMQCWCTFPLSGSVRECRVLERCVGSGAKDHRVCISVGQSTWRQYRLSSLEHSLKELQMQARDPLPVSADGSLPW